MDLSTVVSTSAAVVAVPTFVLLATSTGPRTRWLPAALLALAFAGWSLYAIIDGGVLGFIPEHVGNPWETQIWVDLLILGGTAWYLLQPRLRAAGVRPLPWLPLVLATGSIGMLCLVVRLLRAEGAAPSTVEAAP
ncbi:MAG: hypothetical protein JWQ74_2272 [Marmoricola sp.]|nr:hypothetical protein [Marmoricola sp.]